MAALHKLSSILEKLEQKVGTASILLLILMVIGKVFGLIKLNSMARFFGVSNEADIFVAAFAVPDFIFSLLVVGTVNAALIPVFIKILKKDTKQVLSETLNTIIITLIGLLLVFSIIFYFLIPAIGQFLFKSQEIIGIIKLDPTLSEGSKEYYLGMFINLTRLMLASPFLLTISSVLGAYLQSHKKFVSAALAPVFYNVGIVLGISFFVIFAPQFGIYALGYSVILGSLCHLLVQIPAVLALHPPAKLFFRFNSYVKEVFILSIPRILGLGVEQVAILFNTFWGFTLGRGALSAFQYANSLRVLPVDLLAGSFLQAVFPKFNEAANQNDRHEALNKAYVRALILLLLIAVPVVIIAIVLRIPIVRLTYGAGRFSWSATVATAFVLAFFTPSILFQAIASLNIRTFYSLHNTMTPFVISCIGMALAIVCSILFTNYFSHYHQFSALLSTLVQDPSAFNLFAFFDTFSWFFTRSDSFAAVAGLAFGLSFGLFFEVLLSFILLAQILNFREFLKTDKTYLIHIRTILLSGLFSLIMTYAAYKLLDSYVLDTAHVIQLVVLSLFVGGIAMITYIFPARNVILNYISTERVKRFWALFTQKNESLTK